MTAGTVFTGIGGFDLGFQRAGLTIKWQAEIDPFCRAVLAKHWPDVRRYEDVRDIGADVEYVDVLAAGWPCQPVSSASRGRRRGTADDRWLWPEVARLLALIRPAWFVGENVTHIDGPALNEVVSDLETLGYTVAPPLEVPACAFGLDHRRDRLWFLGYANRHSESRRSVNAEASRLSKGHRDDPGRLGTPNGISRRLDVCGMAALGNALVPDIAQWIAEHIVKVELLASE